MKRFFAVFLGIFLLMIPLKAHADVPYEVYTYDRFGEAVPSQAGYIPEKVVSGYDMGLGALSAPADLFFTGDGTLYIADSDNDRIIETDSLLENVFNVYDSFTEPDGSITELNAPTGVYVSDGVMYIADSGNSRVLAVSGGKVITEITRPQSELYTAPTFIPQKVIADKAGNIYVVLSSITTGAAMFAPDGSFAGYYGANRTEPTAEVIRDNFESFFSSEEKKARRTRNIPAGISGFDIRGDFIYTCTSSSSSKVDIVKKLGGAGKNIFADLELTFGDHTPMYDAAQNQLLETAFIDIDISENGCINCLDYTTGRIFQYDENCALLFIMGAKAHQEGGFETPSALESYGTRLYVADSAKNTVTIFKETDFGGIVHKANEMYNDGFYVEALGWWYEVLRRDGNYTRAYLGIACGLLRQERYREAMKYARLAASPKVYDEAFEGYRSLLTERYGGELFLGIIVLSAGVFLLKKYRRKKHPEENLNKWEKNGRLRYTVMHPIEGFEDMRWKKSGSVKVAAVVLVLLFAGEIVSGRLSGFQFGASYDKTFSIMPYIIRSFVLFGAWVIAGRAVSTFLDGEGSVRNIFIYSAYALVPYTAQLFIGTFLSHILIRDEYVFLQAVQIIGIAWTVILMFSAVKSVHQYSPLRTAGSVLLTFAAMAVMLFLLVLFMSLIQQVYIFISTLYTEISYRIRV